MSDIETYRAILKLPPLTVLAGERAMLQSMPQRTFRADMIALDPGGGFVVNLDDIVGGVRQLVAGEPPPLGIRVTKMWCGTWSVLGQREIPELLDILGVRNEEFRPMVPGMCFTLELWNRTDAAYTFRGELRGEGTR